MFLAAGATIALASATRLEGLLLLIPLAVWSVARWRALGRDGDRRGHGRRLAAGALGCLGIVPALAMAALIVAVLRGHAAAELYRIRPLILAGGWSRTLLGDASASSAVLPNSLGPISAGRMWEIYLPTVVKGLTPLWTLLLAIGAAGAWRARAARPGQAPRPARAPRLAWSRANQVGLVIAQAVLLWAVWVHLWAQHTTCRRYVFPLVLMSSGLAGLGLLRLSAWAAEFLKAGSPWRSGLLRGGAGGCGRRHRLGRGVLLELRPAVGEGRAGPLAPQPGGTVAGADRSGRFHPGRQLLCAGAVRFVPGHLRAGNGDRAAGAAPAQRRAAAAGRRGPWLRRTVGPGAGSSRIPGVDPERLPKNCSRVLVWLQGQPLGGLAWKPPTSHTSRNGVAGSCPVGALENSPAVHCWERGHKNSNEQVPEGRPNARPVQPSLRDSRRAWAANLPSDESLGYYRTSLRDCRETRFACPWHRRRAKRARMPLEWMPKFPPC